MQAWFLFVVPVVLRLCIPVAAALAIALFSWLGFWQIDRADEKERRITLFGARVNDAPISLNQHLSGTSVKFDTHWWRYRHVEIAGNLFSEHQYLLDNRTRNGVPGYHVFLPMLVDGLDRVVLINRGWVAAGPSREHLPDVSLNDTTLVVSGIVDYPRLTLLLGDDGYAASFWPKVVQRIDLDKTMWDLNQPVLPFVVLMDLESPHGFLREWKPYLGIDPDRHRGYAFQWFSLAIAVAIIYIINAYRTKRY